MSKRIFTRREWRLLAFLVSVATVFTVGQKRFIPPPIRPFTFASLVLVVFLAFFGLTKPERPMQKAKGLALVAGGIALSLIVLVHVVIRFDPSYKNAIVLAGAVAGPFVAAWIYGAMRPSRART